MDGFFWFLVIAVSIGIFASLVRSSNREAAELVAKPPVKPLTKQRSSTKTKPQDSARPASPAPLPLDARPQSLPVEPAKTEKPTRAIRTGWSIGEVEFMYEDAKGAVTFRSVVVHWVGDSTFKGQCLTRNAERSFRLDRVLGDITNVATGEVLEPEAWADDHR